MRSQKVAHGIRIETQKTLICFICVLDLLYFPWLSQYAFSVNNCSHLVERKRIVFNGESRMNCLNPAFTPQFGVRIHILPCGDVTDEFADLRYFLYDLIVMENGGEYCSCCIRYLQLISYFIMQVCGAQCIRLVCSTPCKCCLFAKSILYNNCCSWLFSASSHRKCRGYCNALSFESYCFLALSFK